MSKSVKTIYSHLSQKLTDGGHDHKMIDVTRVQKLQDGFVHENERSEGVKSYENDVHNVIGEIYEAIQGELNAMGAGKVYDVVVTIVEVPSTEE